MSVRSRFLLFGTPVLVAITVAWWPALTHERVDTAAESVEVSVVDPREFRTVGDLVAASEAVVLAEVVDTASGRTLTDPGSPEAGIRTRLAELRVVEVLAGAAPDRLVLEEAATLVDGTPVVVGGASPVVVGDRGVFFLVAGRSEAAPHWAIAGPPGRYLVRGDMLEAASEDPLSRSVESAGGPALVDAVEAVASISP